MLNKKMEYYLNSIMKSYNILSLFRKYSLKYLLKSESNGESSYEQKKNYNKMFEEI
jgi:hypothetical protein